MRIIGADSFFGRTTSINTIPVTVLQPFDMCIVKIGTGDTVYTPGIYFYEYILNDGNDEDIPFIIIPVDELDGTDGGSRWKLRNVIVEKLYANDIVTNLISHSDTSVPIVIGDSLEVYQNSVFINGQLTVDVDEGIEPPFIVNSDILVENLNAQYIGGVDINGLVQNRCYEFSIPEGITQMDVYFPTGVDIPPSYSLMVEIYNNTDADPSIYSHVIMDKQSTHFTIKFSGIIDSDNYRLSYFFVNNAS